MDDKAWELLIDRIQLGQCTPFVGAGINYGILPLGGEIAQDWAREYGYPLSDSDDLAKVAQYMAIDHDDSFVPADKILEKLRMAARPDFGGTDDRLAGLRALAALPLPIYLTTNYDNLLVEALKSQGRPPHRDFCRWQPKLKKYPSVFEVKRGSSGFQPSTSNPVVFHLHGHDEVRESLVLTEDDYLDFLVNMSRYKLLPLQIEGALAASSLLFIGYRMRDISFRVLYRWIVQSITGDRRPLSVTVQLSPPEGHIGDPANAQGYLAKYFARGLNVKVYWGTAGEFARELTARWKERHGATPASVR